MNSKSVSTILHYYSQLWPRRIPKPPYNHVVQAGDPILRSPCPKVPIEDIRTIRTLKTIQQLKKTMRLYKCVGLAAPQIGINQRIFIMEFNQEHMASVQPVHIEKYAMSPIPMTVCINPEIQIVSQRKVAHLEGCESIKGYEANVSRYCEITLNAYNEDGVPFTNYLKGWPARIAQHELDHLNGTLFTDKMEKETFRNIFWKVINENGGKIQSRFLP